MESSHLRQKYCKEQLEEVVKKCWSYTGVLAELGRIPSGGNFFTLKKKLKEFCIDISHFTSKPRFYGGGPPKKPLVDILKDGVFYNNNKLRQRLIKEKIFEEKCLICNAKDWQGKPLSFELDHINGSPWDNRIENLRILCPNCHCQTANHRGRNKKVSIRNTEDNSKDSETLSRVHFYYRNNPVSTKCLNCGLDTFRTFCSSACCNKYYGKQKFGNGRKVVRPALEILLKDVQELGYLQTGKKYGVTDNAIRKWIKTETKYKST